jgi:hypothetical protein
MTAERELLMLLEGLSRLPSAGRCAQITAGDSDDLRANLRLLDRLEEMDVPSPAFDTMAQGRNALLVAVAQEKRRSVAFGLNLLPARIAHALPAAGLAAVVVAMTAAAATIAGVGAPRATVSEVLSALGINDHVTRPMAPPTVTPVVSPVSGWDNVAVPEVAETSIPAVVPPADEAPEIIASESPEATDGANKPNAANPGHGGDNPGQGVGPDGTPPGHGGQNPGHGGENPGQGVGPGGTPPGQGGENPGQGGESTGQGAGQEGGGPPSDPGSGNGNGNGQGNKP